MAIHKKIMEFIERIETDYVLGLQAGKWKAMGNSKNYCSPWPR
jgi:hypothetical protein